MVPTVKTETEARAAVDVNGDTFCNPTPHYQRKPEEQRETGLTLGADDDDDDANLLWNTTSKFS